MSEEFKKLNKTIASFMLTSLAISGSAFAQVNENLIAGAMGSLTPQTNTGMVRLLYGVPTKPQVNPNTPTRLLYGVPTNTPTINPTTPAMALYAVPTDPQIVNPSTPTMALYGVPTNPQIVNPNVPTMELYAVPTKQSAYNISDENQEVSSGAYNKIKSIDKDADSGVPVNYVTPIIIPGYYIPDSK